MPVGQAHSLVAEGGINAALGTLDEDTWQDHAQDTLESGRQLNDPALVELLCREVPDRLRELQSYGAGLPTDAAGQITQSTAGSGGQHRKRVVAVSDFIGFVMQRALLWKALKGGLRIMDDALCVELLDARAGGAGGVVIFDLRSQRLVGIRSSRLLLATGGAGQLYSVTTNTLDATGEGYVMAYDLGAELCDLEMIQFHPTALAYPPAGRGLLITEAARGVGGILRNAHGERFMERYAPGHMELASRDIVAQAIQAEIRKGNGTEHGGVWLDLRHVRGSLVEERLRNTQRLVLQHQGRDLRESPVEVTTAAHHMMGGIAPRDQSMECVDGLFVAGEAAWGVHGANRLGGNALAETQVFGHLAALSMIEGSCRQMPPVSEHLRLEPSVVIRRQRSKASRGESVAKIREDLQQVMGRDVGLERSASGLANALDDLEALSEREREAVTPPHFHGVAARFECHQMLRLASLVVRAAALREETRGAHVRSDFPEEEADPKTTVLSLADGGHLRGRR
jgi:fumarate reductase (CoM/CoB) subunit A